MRMVRYADANEDMNICTNLLEGLIEHETDLAAAVKNVSMENNVIDGGGETAESPRSEINRRKHVGRRQTNSDGVVRSHQQRDDINY